MDTKLDEFGREIARAEFSRPSVPPALDRAVLEYARKRRIWRSRLRRISVSLCGVAAAALVAFGVFFLTLDAGRPHSEPLRGMPAASAEVGREMARMWDWSTLEGETMELSAAAEYSQVALASL